MTTNQDIDIHKVLDYIRGNAEKFAAARAQRVWIEEWRKSKKALLMRQAEQDGVKSAVAQERDAYAHPEYAELLQGLKAAVEEEERLRWMLIAAQAKADAWRTIQASNRFVDRSVL